MSSKIALLAFAALCCLVSAQQPPLPPPLPQPLDPFLLSTPIVIGVTPNTNNQVTCQNGLEPCVLSSSVLCIDSTIMKCTGGIICPTEIASVCTLSNGQKLCYDQTKLFCSPTGELLVVEQSAAISGLAPSTATTNNPNIPTNASTVIINPAVATDQALPIGSTTPGFAGAFNAQNQPQILPLNNQNVQQIEPAFINSAQNQPQLQPQVLPADLSAISFQPVGINSQPAIQPVGGLNTQPIGINNQPTIQPAIQPIGINTQPVGIQPQPVQPQPPTNNNLGTVGNFVTVIHPIGQ